MDLERKEASKQRVEISLRPPRIEKAFFKFPSRHISMYYRVSQQVLNVFLFCRFLMPHPIIHPHSDPEPHQKPPKIADCLSCRLWGGVVHVGIAGFVASHIKEMQSRGAKGFLIAFSSGKKKPFYTLYASSKGKFHRFSVSHHSPHIFKQVNFH